MSSGFIGTSHSKSKRLGSSKDTAKVWVHWEGTTIEESYNVAGISNPETGQYIITFITSMKSSNYCAVATSSTGGYGGNTMLGDYTTSTVKLFATSGTAYAAVSNPSVLVFGD